jgi:hypothetical protein
MGCRCKEGQAQTPVPAPAMPATPAPLLEGGVNMKRPLFYFFIRSVSRSEAIDAARKLRVAAQRQKGNDKTFFPIMVPRKEGNEWVVALPFQYGFDCGCRKDRT